MGHLIWDHFQVLVEDWYWFHTSVVIFQLTFFLHGIVQTFNAFWTTISWAWAKQSADKTERQSGSKSGVGSCSRVAKNTSRKECKWSPTIPVKKELLWYKLHWIYVTLARCMKERYLNLNMHQHKTNFNLKSIPISKQDAKPLE